MTRTSFLPRAALALSLSAGGSGCGTVSIDGFREDATARVESVNDAPDATPPVDQPSVAPQHDGGAPLDVTERADDGPTPDGFVSRDGGPPVDLGSDSDIAMVGPTDGPAMGPCATNADCPARSYCEGTGCGTSGLCRARPETCATLYDPVCGCDGRTYSNPCDAAGNGVRASRRGECGTVSPVDAGTVETRPPGCRTNSECERGLYCAGNGCDVAGSCQARPEGCATVYMPVCGCDGVTYSNECVAQVAGARFGTRGACR